MLSLCDRVLEYDPDLRYCAVTDSHGKILAQKLRENVVPKDSQHKWEQGLIARAKIVASWKDLAPHYGDTEYLVGKHAELYVLVFPLKENIVFVTANPSFRLDRLPGLRTALNRR